MITGDNGILTQVARAKEEVEKAKANEQNILTGYEQIINSSAGVTLETITGYETNNTVTQDSLGNRVVVPAGFRVVNPTNNVEDGIVIEDVSHEKTVGSQFVWIPVGKGIKKKDGTTFDIELGRYVFNEDGSINAELSQKEPDGQLIQNLTTLNYYTEGLKDTTTTNVHAKDITTFISKVNLAQGYYIARYEARDGITEEARIDSTSDTNQITVEANAYIYNYVTQSQAVKLSQEMYKDSQFTSDLMNSYTWDTTIDFLQKCDDREGMNNIPYSMQGRISTIFASKGTNNLETKDQICNVFDMASNCVEWTTESSSVSDCVYRTSGYFGEDHHTFNRFGAPMEYNGEDISFRPILYL